MLYFNLHIKLYINLIILYRKNYGLFFKPNLIVYMLNATLKKLSILNLENDNIFVYKGLLYEFQKVLKGERNEKTTQLMGSKISPSKTVLYISDFLCFCFFFKMYLFVFIILERQG